MEGLNTWLRASLVVLSCPGPHRHNKAALLPVEKLVLPQVFLGGEAQLLAFVAAAPAHCQKKMMFAPLPEIFAGPDSLPQTGAAVHLRFGSVRDSRVLKGVPNAAVVAEAESAPPLTTSQHPFASGQLLPASMDGFFVYGEASLRPRRIGGAELPVCVLPQECRDADMQATPRGAKAGGLDLVSLADFGADDWLCGRVAPLPARRLAGARAVLVPWNLAHHGSIIPPMLERLASLWQEDASLPKLVLLPFNDPGQTGALLGLIKILSAAAANPAALLAGMFFARLTHLRGLRRLKKLSGMAWVDGNDPEHAWTISRLTACGIDTVLIDPGVPSLPGVTRLAADEPIVVHSDTHYGPLRFDVRMPSHRALPSLFAPLR